MYYRIWITSHIHDLYKIPCLFADILKALSSILTRISKLSLFTKSTDDRKQGTVIRDELKIFRQNKIL